MKVLIWFVCLFVASSITTLLAGGGYHLGAIPTIILYGATFAAARALSKEWENRKNNRD